MQAYQVYNPTTLTQPEHLSEDCSVCRKIQLVWTDKDFPLCLKAYLGCLELGQSHLSSSVVSEQQFLSQVMKMVCQSQTKHNYIMYVHSETHNLTTQQSARMIPPCEWFQLPTLFWWRPCQCLPKSSRSTVVLHWQFACVWHGVADTQSRLSKVELVMRRTLTERVWNQTWSKTIGPSSLQHRSHYQPQLV